jgi:hypothetical protein
MITENAYRLIKTKYNYMSISKSFLNWGNKIF